MITKKNLFSWHRTLSWIVALPVVLWAASGFMHPVMTNIRPKIATQQIKVDALDIGKIVIPLKTIDNDINQIRIVSIDSTLYYQVCTNDDQTRYFETVHGNESINADTVYAIYLAKKILGSDTTLVTNVDKITAFDHEYTAINRLLPVYKVSFDREDGIAIFVDTRQGRFAFASDNSRRAFSQFFGLIHTWGWLNFLGKGKTLIEIVLSGLAFITSVIGIYIFFSTKTNTTPARRNHRYTAIVVSLFTLMFSFSGCYHAVSKLGGHTTTIPHISLKLPPNFSLDIPPLEQTVTLPITGIQLATIGDFLSWRVIADNRVLYINAATSEIIPDGEKSHALAIARSFGMSEPKDSLQLIHHFNDEYNFADKILPVWKLRSTNNKTYFVETSSGGLSKELGMGTAYEETSFALLHKHEFLSPFGKSVKDFSTMFWAASQIVMVAFGLILFFKIRFRNR